MESEIGRILREERSRILSTLIRALGDFDLAEDAMHSAILVALERWPIDGIPANPRAWITSTARHKGIDVLRRSQRMVPQDHHLNLVASVEPPVSVDDSAVEDDQLRLIFACCHPSLSPEGRVALTLREVCGLTTEEIAHAFLVTPTTIYQRIVRAKAKIRDDQIPFEIPDPAELGIRMESVLAVPYLLFNEGYFASGGESLIRKVLSQEAIRLARLLAELLPEPEVFGLLGLMLLQDARRAARSNEGGLVLFDDQDQSLWDPDLVGEGLDMVGRSLAGESPGAYSLQAAIVAEHMKGGLSGRKHWLAILGFYDQLLLRHPSPIVELNRAVAVAHCLGPEAGLIIVDEILGRGELLDYGLAHSTRAEFCRQLGMREEAEKSYNRALELTGQLERRRFLMDRLAQLS